MSLRILVLNCGSSSIKFCLFEKDDDRLLQKVHGEIEDIGEQACWHYKDAQHSLVSPEEDIDPNVDHALALKYLFDWLFLHLNLQDDIIVGHRVVHGGMRFSEPILITNKIIEQLHEYIPLAPLHQPHNIHAIQVLADQFPQLTQIACFDTAFHSQHKKPINQLALPEKFHAEGVRRYGFHGLSYEYISLELKRQSSPLAERKYITAHLGNGASLCAIKDGKSIDSTMGFSALDGLMMGTRCGAIDPGVLLYLLDQEQLSSKELATLLYKQSGLLGVSGLSYDMRDLAKSEQASAKEAIDLFVYRIVREIGALVAILKGIDGIVFTGGIGENVPFIRSQVIKQFAWLEATIDEQSNELNAPLISSKTSKLRIEIIPTNEEQMIAEHATRLFTNLI